MSKQSEENRGGVDLADRPIAHAHFRRNTPFAQIRSTSYSGVFLVTIILIGVSITLLLTQEPVNLSGSRVRTSNVSDDNGTAKSSTAGSDVVDLNIVDLHSTTCLRTGKSVLKDSYTIGKVEMEVLFSQRTNIWRVRRWRRLLSLEHLKLPTI
ncbi:hypothetical protein Q1695_004188 [Nippostrongylus brasiliensis]|nr:hypothetical protein Q1695_004188 [Nippostrongylus brasiliensis]